MEFSDEIRRLRAAAGLTCRELAAAVGVSDGFITQVERYRKIPSAERIADLAAALKVPPEPLLAAAKEAHDATGATKSRRMLERAREDRTNIVIGRTARTVAKRITQADIAATVGQDAALLLCLIAAEHQPVRFDDAALAAAIGSDIGRLFALRESLAASGWLIISRCSPAAAEYTAAPELPADDRCDVAGSQSFQWNRCMAPSPTPAAINIGADFPPSAEFVSLTAQKVTMHLTAGNWGVAVRTIEAAEREWRQEARAHADNQHRRPREWLQMPLVELLLPTKLQNILEAAGCRTIFDGLAMVASGRCPRSFGIDAIETVWTAAERLGIEKPWLQENRRPAADPGPVVKK